MKTIIRSPLVWVASFLMVGVGLYFTLELGSFGTYDMASGEMIWDKDPRFVLTYPLYIQKLFGTMHRGELMLFAAPALFVITSGIVLTRDWRDNTFEIERAGNVRPATYFLGRFSAVFTFITVAALIEELIMFHLYTITRGGVQGLTGWDYIIDSNIRILRMFFIVVIPGILVFSGITFLAGNLTRSGTVGTIVGLCYVLFEYLANTVLKLRVPELYQDFMTPTPRKLYLYWQYFDTEWFTEKTWHNPFTTEQMLLCLGIIYSAAIVFLVISYCCVKRRRM